jgi:hypothetical protein
VTCIGIARVFFSPPVLQIIQVDASPWAKVTVFSEENKVILPENETPFQAQLSPGTYIFRFAYGAERRDIPVTVTRKSMDAIRCDFWTEEQWRALLPTFK